MSFLNIAIPIIKQFEGLRLKAYQCSAKVWTIGYGNTRMPTGKPVTKDTVITKEEAERMLLDTVTQYAMSLMLLLKVTLSKNQIAALVSFTYNVGVGAFGRSTLLKKVNANPSDPKIRDEFMKWVNVGGKANKGLMIRRKKEADLYFTHDN